jgi:AraC-like DNA-binding protein
MGLSAHQLWRKLQREGSQFQQLRDDIKRDWALSLVENAALSVADVAERLHFHDSSALHKAFQQWTGSSCSDYRQRLWQT